MPAERQLPEGRPVMHQSWRDLLFLHWEWDRADLASRLPPGLEVDTFGGRAYLGVVPFFMRHVRPVGLPALPWLSHFREMNVRTYVRHRSGRTGVWFFSLDCDQPVAVELARRWFGLPYQHAAMSGAPGSWVDYACRRKGFGSEAVRVAYEAVGVPRPAATGTLEEFLVERYHLFSGGGKAAPLRVGRVWHEPYRVASARVEGGVDAVFSWEDFRPPARPPDHILFSPGVDVEIFPLEKVPD